MPSDTTATVAEQAAHEKIIQQFINKTPELYLRKPITHLTADNNEPSGNSDYNGPDVDMFDINVWEDFLTDGEIVSLLNQEPLKTVFHRSFTTEQLDSFTWGAPHAGGNINEQSFERVWACITHALNLIQYICATEEKGLSDPSYIVIGDGGCARKKEPEAVGTERKKPDFSGYELVPGSGQHAGDGPLKVENRIPGDAKLFRKIRRQMLPPNGSEYLNSISVQREAQKVVNQIYDYMDQHGARYGYVVNDQELIFFRRRSTGWGHMDISPAIKHDLEADLECGILNSKYVLFYYHYVIANEKSQWQLASCRPLFEKRTGALRKVKVAKGGVPRNGAARKTPYSRASGTAVS